MRASASASTVVPITLCENTASGWIAAVSLRFLMSIVRSSSEMPFDRSALGTASLMQLLFAPQFRFLWRESVAVNRRLGRAADCLNKGEIRQSRSFLEKILVREGGKSEILPPDRFFLPSMPVQDIGEDPSVLAARASVHAPLPGHRRSSAQSVRRFGSATDSARRSASAEGAMGRSMTLPLFDELRPNVLEPVPQRVCRQTVVAVVAQNNGLELFRDGRRIAGFEKRLYGSQRTAGVFERGGSSESEETFQLLDRVTLDAGANSLPNHLVKIDEERGTKHAVDFVFARGVTAHETF